LECFVVKDKKRIFFVPVSNVLWIEATGNYACIHTASDSHLLRETLAHLEEKLVPHHFIRLNANIQNERQWQHFPPTAQTFVLDTAATL
jgi:hypothetical protein